MGIEDGEIHHELDERANVVPAAETSTTEVTPAETRGDGHVPVEVFDRLADLQQQLAAARATLDHKREVKNAAQQRWRDRHREHVQTYDRARKRQESERRRSQGPE
jgi:hypothetical protein